MRLLTKIAVMVLASLLPAICLAADAPTTQPQRYRISACDWTMLKRQTTGAITRAKQCGCDGVETDMGSLGKNPTFTNQFISKPGFAEEYLKTAKDNGIEISSIAMSGFYAQSFPDRPIEQIEQPAKDCIATMKLLGVKVAFLPLGVYGDLVKKPEARPIVVERLKMIGKLAEDAGVVFGIESSLPAADEIKLLDDVGSPAIRIYFNFEECIEGGRDISSDLNTLGKDRICQIHCTGEDKYWLQDDPAIDMPKIKKTLDDMGWSGWLVIERSRKEGHSRDVIGNFSANAKYLKSIFQAD